MSAIATNYIVVKGSVYSADCTVFGLNKADEEQVLAQFPSSGDVMNGKIIKAQVVVVLNLLARLGFKVVSSTGETDTVWTLEEMEFERGIWSAALEGDTTKIEKLLKKEGISVDIQDAAGYTALHYAARAGNVQTCKLLLRQGAQVNACTRAGQATSLQRAATAGKVEVCRLLLENGADILATDADGKTAYQRAKDNNHNCVMKLLEELGTKNA